MLAFKVRHQLSVKNQCRIGSTREDKLKLLKQQSVGLAMENAAVTVVSTKLVSNDRILVAAGYKPVNGIGSAHIILEESKKNFYLKV